MSLFVVQLRPERLLQRRNGHLHEEAEDQSGHIRDTNVAYAREYLKTDHYCLESPKIQLTINESCEYSGERPMPARYVTKIEWTRYAEYVKRPRTSTASHSQIDRANP